MIRRASPNAQRARGGFAILIALMLIAIVGVCFAALAMHFAGEVRRSSRQNQDAQLRQLLIAGEVAARESLGHGAIEKHIDVKLPDELASAGMSLGFDPEKSATSENVRVRIVARIADGRSMNQIVTYARTGDRWQARAVELD